MIAMLGTLCTTPERLLDARTEWRLGEIVHEAHSDYSHIRVRDRGSVRNLTFVEENGVEQRQSSIDLEKPHEMQLAYTKAFFVSLLFRNPQERVLIVGLGGGGMVRFIKHHFPETHVEAVEIDPAVVKVAAEYFGTSEGPRTTIHTEDAFVFLRESHGPYDVIYMDAFLKPEADSGLEVLTERLKTVTFLKEVRSQLKPRGIVAFNLIEGPEAAGDIEAIGMAFPVTYVFEVPQTRNLVVIGATAGERISQEVLLDRAETLDASLDLGFSLADTVKELREWRPQP